MSEGLLEFTQNAVRAACGEDRAGLIECKCCPDDAAAGGKCPAKTAPIVTMKTMAATTILHMLVITMRMITSQVRAAKLVLPVTSTIRSDPDRPLPTVERLPPAAGR